MLPLFSVYDYIFQEGFVSLTFVGEIFCVFDLLLYIQQLECYCPICIRSFCNEVGFLSTAKLLLGFELGSL